MLDVDIIDDLDTALSLAPAWEQLAVGQALPLCAPGWMLPWFRHLAPPHSELRVVAVRDGSELIALAPWFVDHGPHARIDVRFLGAEISDRVDILCRAGREREVEGELRRAIMRMRPDLVSFEAVPVGSQWTRGLARIPAGRARLSPYRNSVIPAPTVSLPEGGPAAVDSWLAGRSSNFRGQMRRMRRRLQARGGRVRQIVETDELERALDTLLALHAARWEGRAPSGLTRPGVRELLREAAGTLGPDRVRLWAAEIDGTPISIQLFLAAGGEIKYWNGGWLEEHADLKPTMLTILAALEDGIRRGERRLDLGAGTHAYKLRFADGEDALTWGGLILRNGRWARTRAELMPRLLRYRAKQAFAALPAPLTERVETAVRARNGRSPSSVSPP